MFDAGFLGISWVGRSNPPILCFVRDEWDLLVRWKGDSLVLTVCIPYHAAPPSG
jgi:hypothetical protein